MAETVTIDGQQYLKRHPLGVLGLALVTLGVYFFVWFYKVNDELRRSLRDETISPTRSLMAIIFGWLLIAPPFIAIYNTAKHVQGLETRRGVGQTIEPALTVALMFVFAFVNGTYIQEHLNRAWSAPVGAAEQLPVAPSLAPVAP
jgi:hypothetical protein